MSLEIANALLSDERPEVRKAGLAALADEPSAVADELLIGRLADKAELVWRAACAVLKTRHPWLVLEPFPVRPVPSAVAMTDAGREWAGLRQALRNVLHRGGNATGVPPDRWSHLPGIVPDVVEALAECGRRGEADAAADAANLYGRSARNSVQVMLACTYRCNLNCSYCYAKGWGEQFPADMSPDDLRWLFSWLKRQKINAIVLGGGEPTEYKHFSDLLRLAREQGVQAPVTSNCLYSAAVRREMTPPNVPELVAHYEQDRMKPGHPSRRLFLANIRAARSAGVPLLLRYTMTSASDMTEWRPLMKLARELGVRQLNYAWAFRNFDASNSYFNYNPADGGNAFSRLFAAFADDAEAFGLKLWLCKPVPLCALTMELRNRLLLSGFLRSACAAYLGDFTRNLTINPDLSTFPCNGLGIRGPRITEDTDLAALGSHFEGTIKGLLYHPFCDACKDCLYWYRGFCQGVCLAEHYSMVSHAGG